MIQLFMDGYCDDDDDVPEITDAELRILLWIICFSFCWLVDIVPLWTPEFCSHLDRTSEYICIVVR